MSEPEYKLTRYERLLTRNRYTLWAGSWLAVIGSHLGGIYDELMLRLWPYDRYPHEWKSLFRRRTAPDNRQKDTT